MGFFFGRGRNKDEDENEGKVFIMDHCDDSGIDYSDLSDYSYDEDDEDDDDYEEEVEPGTISDEELIKFQEQGYEFVYDKYDSSCYNCDTYGCDGLIMKKGRWYGCPKCKWRCYKKDLVNCI